VHLARQCGCTGAGDQRMQRSAGGRSAVMSIALPVALRPTGLVAAYGFDEVSGSTAADLSGNNNTGTLGTGIARTTQGRFGGAPVFNGSGFVTIPNTTSLALRTGMTLEAWVNTWSHLAATYDGAIMRL